MKLTYQQVTKHLHQALSSIYLIGGDEVFLRQEVTQQIKKAGKKSNFMQSTQLSAENDPEWQHLFTELYSTSFFSEKKCLEVDLRSTAISKSLEQLLTGYTTNFSRDILLIIHMDKLDAKITKHKWYQVIEQQGIVITLWPMTRDQLPNWLIQRAKKYKLNLAWPQANFLADYCQGNAAAGAQALEKLYLLQTDGELHDELITTIMHDESQFNTFELIDYCLAGDIKNYLHTLKRLKTTGSDPILILWALTRELRTLSILANESAWSEALFKKHQIFPRRQSLIRQFLTRHTQQHCHTLVTQAAFIDRMIKGALAYDPWQALELFGFRINTITHAI